MLRWVSSDFEADLSMRGSTATLRLSGSLDSRTVGALDDLVDAAIGAGADHLVLDLGEISYLQSAAIRSMLQARHRLRATDSEPVTISHASPIIRRIVDTCGLADLLLEPETP